jgi:hypothetical protein
MAIGNCARRSTVGAEAAARGSRYGLCVRRYDVWPCQLKMIRVNTTGEPGRSVHRGYVRVHTGKINTALETDIMCPIAIPTSGRGGTHN